MVNMDKPMFLAIQCLYFGLFLNIPLVASQTTANWNVGQAVKIPCGVGGTYTLPQWRKDGITLTNQGVALVNPNYPAHERLSYDSDQKTLMVSDAQVNDSGTYECTHSAGTNSPQNTIVVIAPATTTQPAILIIFVICCGVSIAVCVFFVLVILVLTVVIIKCSHILIREHKRQKEEEEKEEKNGKPKDNDGRNKIVWVIIITATVIFIAVSVWFIVMQATVEDCKEMKKSECNVHIGLLAFEVVGFVLGVGFVIYLFYNYRASPDFPTCDQCGGVKTPSSSGGDRSTAAVKPTAEINPDPRKQRSVMKPIVKPKSGDTGQCHPDVSPQHRPQPAPPSNERHGSDLSSVSRRDVKLDPIPPIRKNNSTTEFHMDNPESERSNIKVSSRGLSAVFDQEYDQPPTNRLAPLDHTVRDESIRRKKKKKKTRTNNDNVKFDNDYD